MPVMGLGQGSIHSHFFRGASAAALVANPTADSEIQPYFGAMEGLLLSIQAAISALAQAVGAHSTFGLQIVQEPAYVFGQTVAVADAPYPIVDTNNDYVITGGFPSETEHILQNKIVPRDADMIAFADGPGSDDADILAHILYGAPLYVDQMKGKRMARYLEDANDAAADAWEELEQSPINTLDPQKLYALIGLGGVHEDEPLECVRISCPSFGGCVPKALNAMPTKLTRWYDSRNGRQLAAGIFSGAESLTVEVWNGGTPQKPGAIIELIELNNEYALSQGGKVIGGGGIPSSGGMASLAQAGANLFGGLVR